MHNFAGTGCELLQVGGRTHDMSLIYSMSILVTENFGAEKQSSRIAFFWWRSDKTKLDNFPKSHTINMLVFSKQTPLQVSTSAVMSHYQTRQSIG